MRRRGWRKHPNKSGNITLPKLELVAPVGGRDYGVTVRVSAGHSWARWSLDHPRDWNPETRF